MPKVSDTSVCKDTPRALASRKIQDKSASSRTGSTKSGSGDARGGLKAGDGRSASTVSSGRRVVVETGKADQSRKGVRPAYRPRECSLRRITARCGLQML